MLDTSRLFTAPAQLPPIAVVVCQDAGHRHVGIAYHVKGVAMLLHQAWHKIQKVDTLATTWDRYGGRVVFCCPDLDQDRAKAISGFCRAIARNIATGNSDIAYSFKYDPDAYFDRHTGRLCMPNGKGLTCVTYVLVIFKTARLPIIDFEQWPPRAEDEAVHRNLGPSDFGVGG